MARIENSPRADSDSLIDNAIRRMEFAERIETLAEQLDDDTKLRKQVVTIVQSVGSMRLKIFEEEYSSLQLMNCLAGEGLKENDDDDVKVFNMLERLTRKNYSEPGRVAAAMDIFALHDRPTQTMDPREGSVYSDNKFIDKTKGKSSFRKMSSSAKRRGFAVIANVETFDEELCKKNHGHTLSPRSGSQQDVDMLARLFKWLRFEVIVLDHANVQGNMLKAIEFEIRNLDYCESDWFVCCLLSHGDGGRIISSDGTSVAMDNIFKMAVNPAVCPVLAKSTLPKMFFVQTCREPFRPGTQSDSAGDIAEADPATPGESQASQPHGKLQLPGDNFLYAYATREGDKAYRFPAVGSLFILKLDECIREMVPRHSQPPLQEILTEVRLRCREACFTAEGKRGYQVTSVVDEIDRLIYLDFETKI